MVLVEFVTADGNNQWEVNAYWSELEEIEAATNQTVQPTGGRGEAFVAYQVVPARPPPLNVGPLRCGGTHFGHSNLRPRGGHQHSGQTVVRHCRPEVERSGVRRHG